MYIRIALVMCVKLRKKLTKSVDIVTATPPKTPSPHHSPLVEHEVPQERPTPRLSIYV